MSTSNSRDVLVHLASGIGNIVLATPLLRVLDRSGLTVDLLLDADYPGVAELFKGWSAVRRVFDGRERRPAPTSYQRVAAAVPPFYWRRFARYYSRAGLTPYRPPDQLFFRHEQAYYLEFGRAIGCDVTQAPHYFLPIVAERRGTIAGTTLVLAPGCKTGIMAAKRWPYFSELAEHFDDVVVVGTEDDRTLFGGEFMRFPGHVRSFVGRLSLRETASILAGAGAVVANDGGLGHVAGACGVPTILLFGPTPHTTLGDLPPNVTVLRTGLACEPCWERRRLYDCSGTVQCLQQLSVEEVTRAVGEQLDGIVANA